MNLPLRVVEHGSGIYLDLDDARVGILRRESARWRHLLRLREDPITLTHVDNRYLVCSRGVLGCAAAGDTIVEIVPKFIDSNDGPELWGTAIWNWIAYASGLSMANVWTRGSAAGRGIADLMADSFLRSLSAALPHGLPVQYSTRHARSSFLRGRLAINRIVDPMIMDGRLPIIERTLTGKTSEARLLRWAAETLARVVQSSNRRIRLLEAARWFPQQAPAFDMRVDVAKSSRQFPMLAPALELAMLLQAGRSLAPGGTDDHLPGFLCSSDVAFEKAVRRFAGEAGARHGLRSSKLRFTLATPVVPIVGRREVFTTPDVAVTQDSGKHVVMLDAKYRMEGGAPTSDEVYQVAAAGRVAQTDAVALVYPRWGGGNELHRYEITRDGFPKHVTCVLIDMKCFESQSALASSIDWFSDWLSALLIDIEAPT